ncbi:MAG: hypothetical protein A2157_10755 [Deltaproteobacteria bacterium RBG_16_47_11]|nr:MAG: hypothetical protein A2157_10755 [Deltaproteobacteria bacterium RBG_16_47_11]
MLEIRGLNKSFGGLKAIDTVSFNIRRGELSSIIGPNGAGKTTLFNLLSSYLRPDSGSILFEGEDIVGLHVSSICKRGLARSFQRSNIFLGLSVFENVQGAVISHQGKSSKLIKRASGFSDINKRVYQILEEVGLEAKAIESSTSLAHGDLKLLDIAISLSLNPKMLLLDEPTAGMSPEERHDVINFITSLWKKRDLTIVFIEHDMDLVFANSQIIRVLNHGQLIAEGKPEEIRNNREVVTAYLGE